MVLLKRICERLKVWGGHHHLTGLRSGNLLGPGLNATPGHPTRAVAVGARLAICAIPWLKGISDGFGRLPRGRADLVGGGLANRSLLGLLAQGFG